MIENRWKGFTTYFKSFSFVICLLLAALALLALAGCGSEDSPAGRTNPAIADQSAGAAGASSGGQTETARLDLRLSAGQAQPETGGAIPLAEAEPLSEEQTARILARLPALVMEAEDQMDFRIPEEPLPPPRTGETIEETFPPPPESLQPEAVEVGELEVLRYSPEGEISVAPFLSVTFNQPMVALATIEDLAEAQVPVEVQPDLPGTWRWVGTKTLTFQHDSELVDRLPKATEYQVTIPAGTRSAVGGELAEAVSWTFSTPPLEMISSYPDDDPQPLDPVFMMGFDQRIDPQALIEKVRVTANSQPVSIQLADDQEIESDKGASRLAERAGEGRWLAFRASEPLPADAAIAVVLEAGAPSAEGPLVTGSEQGFNFRTYAPLRIVDHGCSWGDDPCRPLAPWFIEFNNPVDASAYASSMITIEPGLPGATVDILGERIVIRGASEGQTTYQVTVAGSIKDVFGQTLGEDETLRFRIGPAEAMLFGPDDILVTLDPAAESPVFSVYSLNYSRLNLKIYAVQPADWPAFKAYLQEYQRTDRPSDPPGRLVEDRSIPVEAPSDSLTEVGIDLEEVMDGRYGHFIVIVEPPATLTPFDDYPYWQVVQAWVQVTQIGLDAFADHSELVVWATGLQDGAPLDGVTVESGSTGRQATTGQDGLAGFDLLDAGTTYLVARKGADQVLLPRSTHYWGEDAWQTWSARDELRWYVFDDRQMYRPGEEMQLKGWLRRLGGKQDGGVGLVGDAARGVSYQVIGPQGNTLGSGSAQVNALGGFDFAVTLPENANLGYASISMQAVGSLGELDGRDYYHSFQIQEFRRPEFEVSARNETSGPYFVGDHAVVAVAADYYAGGPLPNAEVTWLVTSTTSQYSPPNWPDFNFGIWRPWWWGYEMAYEGGIVIPGETGFEVETFSGVTDASGEHYLRLDFEEAVGLQPFSVLAEAQVIDVNRQAWAGTTSLLVHPAELYVGLRSARTFVERGDPLEIDLIVTDIDGNPVEDRVVEVTAARMEWKYSGGDWRQEEVDPQECQVGSKLEPVSCTFETPLGGRYRITALVTDQAGRQNMSQLTRWVSGAERPPARNVEQETLELIPDQESYQPGETARILVQAPFSPAEGLLTVSRSGMLYNEPFRMDESTITLEIPIEEAHLPNLHVQVDLVGSAARVDEQGDEVAGAPPRPAYASGTLVLDIPPAQRVLTLEAVPRQAELEPGGETSIDLRLTDAEGIPVPGAELAVVVVDEAILALSNYTLADPMSIFYTHRPSFTDSRYGRASIVLVDPLTLAGEISDKAQQALATAVLEREVMVEEMAAAEAPEAEGAFDEAAAQGAEPIRVRLDFNPLATFAPQVRTDASGEAVVEVSLPDNLTRYRVMVVAVDDTGRRFGKGESNLTARLPLMVRPSAPRFLNFGDRFELPVVLQNQTDETLNAQVVIEASNLELTGAQGLAVRVPANDRVEVRFPAAALMPGTARFQVAAVAGDYADAATVELPVYTPATTEAFATYGVIDEGAIVQPVASPGDVFPQFGGLEVSTSSTALQALTDAVLYLVAYPFECSEQIASRVLGVAALRDVLSAFSAEGLPSAQEMEEAVQRDIAELERLQNSDGGFPYWRRGRESIPFNTIHVAHALQRAKLKGYQVPEEMQMMVLDYLRYIEDYYPPWYSRQVRQTLSAYALYVRDLMGDRDVEKARSLYNEATLEDLSLEAVAWLWQVMQDDPASTAELDAIRRHINNRAVETAGAANFTTSYADQAYLLLHSNRRTDAVILDALIADDPQSDLIPKVVNGLLAHRTEGRWGNTQENVFVLLALDRYFNTYEAQTPDFVARVWLGENYAGEHRFAGRTTERHQIEVPMAYLVGDTQDLVLSKEGDGRLYYRLGLRYAPSDLELDPLEMGFVVQRSYEAVDDEGDVYRDEDGVWHIKAGARVRVRLTMVADNRRYHVALVDPLPAGLEIVNPALAVSGSVPQDPDSTDYRYGWWWWWTWYEHQNMRDERAEAFTPLLWDGVYEYTYVARATTPGTFVVPPAKAEEMYSPEVFGRSASDLVVVEDGG